MPNRNDRGDEPLPSSDRQWPAPRRPHRMRMGWHDLLFAHWPFPVAEVQACLPEGLVVDEFDGQAWIGVVPFRMDDVAPRGIPALPWLSRFPELNVRTYVTLEGKPGVWFFSLDAANPVAVRVARQFFHLPYMDAEMHIRREAGWYRYLSDRTHRGAGTAKFRARYRPTGEGFRAAPGSLEHWLTARYCLYAQDRTGRTLRGEIDHEPWELQPAEAEIEENTMLWPLGLNVEGPPHLLFVKGIQVQAWANAPLDGG